MRLAGPTGADQDQGPGFLNERAIEKAYHHGPLEFWAQTEVEAFQRSGEREPRRLELAPDLIFLAPHQLFAQQFVQELGIAQFMLLGLRNPARIDLADATELEAGEFMFQVTRAAHAPPRATSRSRSRLVTYRS